MSDNLDLYRLELTEEPYQAQFITTAENALPPECVLPEPLEDIPPLPNLDLTLPPLGCNFNIDVPLIPPPHFCVPGVSGSITVTSPAYDEGEPGLSITGSASIARVSGSECDYALDGDFEISLQNVCNKVFVVRQEVISSGCTGPTAIRVIWESNCTVFLSEDMGEFVGVLSSDFRDYTSSANLRFNVTCCAFKQHVVNVVIPNLTSEVTGSVTLEAETPEGPISIGVISVTASSCGVVIDSTPNPIVIPIGSGDVVDVDDTIPGISSSCVSSADWLHLEKTIGVDDEVIIGLTGNFPQPCFTCDPLNTGGTYVSSITIDKLKTNEIEFNNGCCTNDYSYWDNCGQTFQVGPTAGGSTQFRVAMEGANPTIEYSYGGTSYYKFSKTLIQPAIDEGAAGIQPREYTVCDGGTIKRALIMASAPWTP